MSKNKSSILKNTLVIFIVTLVSVALLAVVNQVTKGPIEEAQIKAEAESLSAAYTGAASFVQVDGKEEMLEKSAELLESAEIQKCTINNVLAANDANGNIIGYAISATTQNGYGADLQIAVGITNEGKIAGFDVISNNETPGFGANCTQPEFKSQFAGKSAEGKLSYSKTGASSDNEIDAISGATITTNAVTEAVNAAIVFYQENFGGGYSAAPAVDPMQQALPEADIDALTDVAVVNGEGENYTVNEVKEAASGYIVIVTAHNGYDGDLQIALGIGKDGIIKGYSALVCNETPGLGAQCKEEPFSLQFAGLKAETIKFVPSGANAANNEIDAIAAATITTNAAVTAVNGAVDYYNAQLKGE